ncbi:MAG: hypothetical protein NZO58_07690, partial [Gemmataceae bacterium]|nr:hypothetical protein [Gemmataceae bacterium]
MKKLAATSLALALGIPTTLPAQQSVYFKQETAAPPPAVTPVAAAAPQMPSGSVVPVRVHFGGALT